MPFKRKYAAIAMLLAALLVLQTCPPVVARAGAYRRDENYVGVQPGDIDIWDNGNGISVSAGGRVCSIGYTYNRFYEYKEYLAFVSKYLDSDGEYTVEVNVFTYSDSAFFCPSDSHVSDDKSPYFRVRFSTNPNSMFSTEQGWEGTIKLRDGQFMSSSGTWQEEPVFFMSKDHVVKGSAYSVMELYSSPYYSGKYIVYGSKGYTGNDSSVEGFPVTLLPNAPLGAGDTDIPYRTTFRMLTDGALVYNTFYYTSSYMSGADEISASGKIRLDATKLSDGTVTTAKVSAPQLLCQISSYGTAYDIVSTNDDNLLSLLGISKPPEKYWDVASQQWKAVPGSTSGGGGNTPGTVPEEEAGVRILHYDLTPFDNFVYWLERKGYPAAAGVVSLLDLGMGDMEEPLDEFSELVADYLGLYTYDDTIPRFGYLPDAVPGRVGLLGTPAGTAVKQAFMDGLSFDTAKGHYVWSPPAGTAGVAGLGNGVDADFSRFPHRTTFRMLSGGWTVYNTFYYTSSYQSGGDTISASGEIRLEATRLSDGTVSRYAIAAPQLLCQVSSYGTVYDIVSTNDDNLLSLLGIEKPAEKYWDVASQQWRDGTGSQGGGTGTGPGSGSQGGSTGSGGTIIIGGPSWEGIGEFNSYIQTGIADGVSSAGSFLSGLLSSAKGIILDLGVVPDLLAELFSFLPAGITTIIGVGLGLWLLPSLLGLARSGVRAAGGMFSSLFRFIASFFS